MSSPAKAKSGAVEKCTDEELLVLMIASTGGTAPGIKAYEVYAKLDEKGHSATSFRHTFSALAVKAKELLAKHQDVELLDAVKTDTPKKTPAAGRKRKATDGGETGEGGESGAASASGGGKKAPAAGRKRKAASGGEADEGGEDGAASASGSGKKVKFAVKAKGGEDGTASASGGGKKAKTIVKAKAGGKKGGKKISLDVVTTEEEEGLGEMVFSHEAGFH